MGNSKKLKELKRIQGNSTAELEHKMLFKKQAVVLIINHYNFLQ
jgi:hypothetical protein